MQFCKYFVLALCCVSLVQSQSLTEPQSRVLINTGVKVSVSSVRNETGHWVTEVTLSHDNSGSSKSSSWNCNVVSLIPSCLGGNSTSGVKLTCIAPPQLPTPLLGYQHIAGVGYYKFHTTAEHWPRAKQVCEEEGSHLVIVNSEEESKAMMKLFTLYPNITDARDNNIAWVGIRESATTNGVYETVLGEPLASTGFVKWYPHFPQDTAPGSHISIHATTGLLTDHTFSSNYKYAFICEQGQEFC